MTAFEILLLLDIAILFLAARLIFKDSKSMKRSIHCFFDPNMVTFWRNRERETNYENSCKVEMLLVVLFIVIGVHKLLLGLVDIL